MNHIIETQFDEKNDKREKSAEKDLYQDKNININELRSTQSNTGINAQLEEEDQKEDVKEDEKEKEEEKTNLIKLKEEESQTPYDPNSKMEVDNYLAKGENLQDYREDQEDFRNYQEDAQNDNMVQDSLEVQENQGVDENNNENNIDNNVENIIENANENAIMEENLNLNNGEVTNNEDIVHITEDIQPQAQDQDITENETTAAENEENILGGPQNFNDNNINEVQLFQANENMMDMVDYNPPNEENDDEKLDINFYQPESNI